MRKFRNFFFDDLVLSTLNYHPVSIWRIFNASKAFIKSESYTPLRVWVSLIRLFPTRFIGKLAEVMSQKFSQIEEPVSKIISALIVIWYNATYAHKRTLTKRPRNTLKSYLFLEFRSILFIVYVRLRGNTRKNPLKPFLKFCL